MKLFVAEKEFEITLRAWTGENWSEDFFHDMETGYSDGITVDPDDFKSLVEYWESEVDLHNTTGKSGAFTSECGELSLEVREV